MSHDGIIDLRSDTVTRPGPGMRRAMAQAKVGDDVFADDPTVNRLEAMAAERAGFEAALFVPSGTQSNLCALLTHCGRGDEYVVGQGAHTYRMEGGGAAVLGGIQPQPLDLEDDGTLDLEAVAANIKPRDPHFAITHLVCLENTHNGKVLPLDYLDRAREFVSGHGLALHLDGARVFNASVKAGVDVQAITRHFDSVSICLSKGLGAPVGSVLCAARDFVDTARRWRKVLGGGMRQAGIVAAAGIIALTENVDRLAEDHEHAQVLAHGLARFADLHVDTAAVQTNMVFASVGEALLSELRTALRAEGILTHAVGTRLRLVTHLDITRDDVAKTLAVVERFFLQRRAA